MRVAENGLTVEQLSDPDDPMLRVMVASVTGSWFREGIVRPTQPILAGIDLLFTQPNLLNEYDLGRSFACRERRVHRYAQRCGCWAA